MATIAAIIPILSPGSGGPGEIMAAFMLADEDGDSIVEGEGNAVGVVGEIDDIIGSL